MQGKQELESGFSTRAGQLEHNRAEAEVTQRGVLNSFQLL